MTHQLEILRVSHEVEVEQVRALGARKAERDHAAVESALARLVDVSRTDENMIPAMLDACRVEAALGEICDALRAEWGSTASPPPVLSRHPRTTTTDPWCGASWRTRVGSGKIGPMSTPFSRPGAVDLSALKRPAAPAGAAPGRPAGPAPSGAAAGGGAYSVDLDEQNFQAELQGVANAPVVLVFYSAQMPQSVTLAQDLDTLADEFEGRFLLGKVDVDASPGIAQALQIPSVPLVALAMGGQLAPLLQDRPAARGARPAHPGAPGRHRPGRPAGCSRRGGAVPDEEGEQVDPRYAPAQDALAAGDIEGAVAEYQKLVDANPADAEAAGGLAMAKVLQRTAHVDAPAAQEARAAAAQDPDSVEAQTLVADLDLLGGRGGRLRPARRPGPPYLRRRARRGPQPPARAVRGRRQRRPAGAQGPARPGQRPVLTPSARRFTPSSMLRAITKSLGTTTRCHSSRVTSEPISRTRSSSRVRRPPSHGQQQERPGPGYRHRPLQRRRDVGGRVQHEVLAGDQLADHEVRRARLAVGDVADPRVLQRGHRPVRARGCRCARSTGPPRGRCTSRPGGSPSARARARPGPVPRRR